MKKKWVLTGSAVGISGALMLVTGLTAFAGTSGYEDYKSALKNTAQSLQSVTVQASSVLKDNGTVLGQIQGDFKTNLQTEAVSGTINISGTAGTQNLSLYNGSDRQVWKSGDSATYYVKQDKTDKEEPNEDKESLGETVLGSQEETVIDALIGNLKNGVTSTTASNGTKNISLSLESAQIPAVVQAIAPLAFKHLSDHSGWDQAGENGKSAAAGEQGDPEELLQKSLLSAKDIVLTDGIQIQNISMSAVISPANVIQSQQFTITFTGLDAKGASHTLTGSLYAGLSGFNETTPDSIDLKGKQVVQVKGDHERGHHE